MAGRWSHPARPGSAAAAVGWRVWLRRRTASSGARFPRRAGGSRYVGVRARPHQAAEARAEARLPGCGHLRRESVRAAGPASVPAFDCSLPQAALAEVCTCGAWRPPAVRRAHSRAAARALSRQATRRLALRGDPRVVPDGRWQRVNEDARSRGGPHLPPSGRLAVLPRARRRVGAARDGALPAARPLLWRTVPGRRAAGRGTPIHPPTHTNTTPPPHFRRHTPPPPPSGRDLRLSRGSRDRLALRLHGELHAAAQGHQAVAAQARRGRGAGAWLHAAVVRPHLGRRAWRGGGASQGAHAARLGALRRGAAR